MHHFFGIVLKGNQNVGLSSLAGLIDDQAANFLFKVVDNLLSAARAQSREY